MKLTLFPLFIPLLTICCCLHAASTSSDPTVTLSPFEPPISECYNWDEKFSHPKELIAPKFIYPFEMRRAAIDGEVGILVQIDERGYPKRLSILYTTQDEFSRAAILALRKARWDAVPNRHGRMGVWFYYRAIYRVKDLE